MRTRIPWILGMWILAASPGFAQTPPTPPPPAAGPLALPDGKVSSAPAINVVPAPAASDSFQYWARAEYLAYWVKNKPVPISLVTGDPNNPTQELLNSDRGFGMFSGFRIGLGFWLDPYQNLGVESSVFALQRRTREFQASSDDSGNPTLAFPFVNQTPGAVGDMLMPITSPGQFAGNVLVSSSLQLWGADFNGVLSLAQTGQFQMIALAGFRYVDLRENLNISALSADITTRPNAVLFQSDQFNTRNQFYGGQIGSRFSWTGERIAFDMVGKVALGANHEVVQVQGVSAQTGPVGFVNGVFPGGFFAQPTNMGHFNANQFAVIPSVELKLHVFLTQHLRAFVGYDFMYWNQVVRPGSQVDRNINLSQSAVLGAGTLSGPASPGPLFNRTDFWAHGVTFGLELRF